MTPVALRDAGVAHLEYLFSPPGLPLVGKGGSAPPTTSVLIRGPAGAGKTTLAIALAHAIATSGGGSVYYLSTEIAPVDAVRKGEQAGVERSGIADARDPRPGARLYVDHLAAHIDPEEEDPGKRTQRALVRAWEWVEAYAASCTPRALVIDAFSLVGATHVKEERTRLLQLIQALESLGVTPVLVEEAGATGADWAAYLVDLVFELGWGTDPDTGHRYRTLACPKSRYADAAYGPHDYGREEGRIAVWPPLVRLYQTVAEGGGRSHFPTTAIPMVEFRTQSYVVLGSGSIVGRSYSATDDFPTWLTRLPWLPGFRLSIGSVTHVQGGLTAYVDEGPHCIGWICYRRSIEAPGWVDVVNLHGVGLRERFRDSIRDDLQVLAKLGAVVVIQGSEAELDAERLPFTVRTGPKVLVHATRFPVPPPMVRLLVPENSLTLREELFTALPALSSAPDRPALLRYSALAAAYTRTKPALDWLLTLTDPEERKSVAPWVAAALAEEGRVDEARAWVDLTLSALPPRTPEQLAEIEAALTASIPDRHTPAPTPS